MDLSVKSQSNLNHLIGKIGEKLQIVNRDLLRSEDFSLSSYDQVYEIYTLLERQESVSTFQIEAVLMELKNIRESE